MNLGAFSVSLSVKDLAVSRVFYEKLGFTSFGGNPDMGYLMMRNGEHVLGLFQGMFEGNLLTFNPGWDQHGQAVEGAFDDVRKLYARAREEGLEPVQKLSSEAEQGPASFVLVDPDGNAILIDQHR